MFSHRCSAAVKFLAGLGLLLACAVTGVWAQPPDTGSQLPNPRIFTMSPCGGKAGSTFEVTFTGTDIEEPEELVFSHAGLKAEPIAAPAPKPDPKQPPPPPKRGRQEPKNIASKFKTTIREGTPPGVQDVRRG